MFKKYYNILADLLLKYKVVDLRSEYSSSILKVFSGGSVAFIIGFLAMPIISRIYPPEEFGRFQLMFSIVTSFAVISTFRYEMAIVLEDTKEDRDKLVTLCLILLLFTTSIFTLIFFFFGEEILTILNAKELTPYIGFMSLMFLGYGLYELSRYSFISEKKFSALAINNITYQGTTAGLQVGAGNISPNFFTLFGSLIVGYFAAFSLAFYKLRFKLKINTEEAKHLLKKHKKFFFFEFPNTFLSSTSSKMPIFFLTKYHGVEFAGYYSMALIILDAPLAIISSSFQQVYIKSAAEYFKNNKVELLNLYKNTIKKITIISIFPFIFILIFGDFIIDYFLGAKWYEVSWILKLYSFVKIFQFVNSSVVTTYTIMNKQEIATVIIIISLVLRFLSLFIFRFNYEYMIITFFMGLIIYYLIWNVNIYFSIKREIK